MDGSLDMLHRPSVPVDLLCGSLGLSGFSIAGLATYLMVPSWKIVFDMGECPVEAVRLPHVFLTHSHGDHARGLLRHFSLRRMLDMPPATYHVPDYLVDPLRRLAMAWCDLEGHRGRDEYIPDFRPMGRRDTVELNRQLLVSTFPVDHRVRSLGFTVQEVRKKLKHDFAGTPGHELDLLKRQGEQIEDKFIHPRLTFIADTTVRTLEREPHILESEVLVIETTFLTADDLAEAQPKGHLHLLELRDFLEAHRDACRIEHLVLKHFSMKYPRRLIQEAVRSQLPEWILHRTHLLI